MIQDLVANGWQFGNLAGYNREIRDPGIRGGTPLLLCGLLLCHLFFGGHAVRMPLLLGGAEAVGDERGQAAEVVFVVVVPVAVVAAVFAADDADGFEVFVQYEVEERENAVGLEVGFDQFLGRGV